MTAPAEDPRKKGPGTAEGSDSDQSANMRLMKAMGVPNGAFNPMPDDQHGWQRHYIDPLIKLWSWSCDNSLAYGHRRHYACDSEGNPLHIQDAARDLNMDPSNLRRAWYEGIEMGVFRRRTGKEVHYIMLNGKVDMETLEKRIVERRKKGEQKVVLTFLPDYVKREINKLPKDEQEKALTEYSRNEALRDQLLADAKAAVDLLIDTRQNTAFASRGVKIRRADPQKKKVNAARRAGSEGQAQTRTERIQLMLPLFEKFVQTVDGDRQENLVQTEKSASYEPFPKSVQSSHLLNTESSSEFSFRETTPSSSSAAPEAPAPPPANVPAAAATETTTNSPPVGQSTLEELGTRLNNLAHDHKVRYLVNDRITAQLHQVLGIHAETWLTKRLVELVKVAGKDRPRIRVIYSPNGLVADAIEHVGIEQRDAEKAAAWQATQPQESPREARLINLRVLKKFIETLPDHPDVPETLNQLRLLFEDDPQLFDEEFEGARPWAKGAGG